ncbi:MAG: hypothetical protein RSE41_07750 [Clostridia bacterium]
MNEQIIKFIKKCMWIAIGLFIFRCFLSHAELINSFSIYSLFGFAGEAIGITTIIMFLYEKYIWKFNPLENTPKLKKKYKGILKTTYDATQRNAILIINQSLLSVNVSIMTEESKSNSISVFIENVNGEWRLVYTYHNVSSASVRERSAIHYGTSILSLNDTSHLKGQYFTDRKTTGDMDFQAVSEGMGEKSLEEQANDDREIIKDKLR